MSDLARLTSDLARRLGAERIVAVGPADPARLAELAERHDVAELEDATEAPHDLATSLLVCDGALEALDDPSGPLNAISDLLDRAPGAMVTIADSDLLVDGERPARWSTERFCELLAGAGLNPVWLGLTDAHGSLGRRAGLTCVLSKTRAEELGEALAAGPLGLGFDPALPAAAATSRQPRVCIASYEFVGPTRTGGIGTAYTSLAEALAEAGHEVTVLFTGWEEPVGPRFGHWVRHYERRGIELARLSQDDPPGLETGHRHARRSYEAYRWLRDREASEPPFDVIHFPEVLGHGYYAIAARRLRLAFGRTTIAIGTHSSTSWVLEANGTLFQALDDLADDFIERRCVEDCDALISPSAYMLDWMRDRRWQLPERHFVQQYVRSRAVAELAAGSKPDLELSGPAEAPELVFFGRLEPRKGLRVFCDALDLLAADGAPPDLRVTFLGKQGMIDGIEAGRWLADRSSAWPWAVSVSDDLAQPEAIAHLRAPGRRLTVVPSLADNSPNTVYEALALQIPFIASRVGGTAELIDPRDLAAATFDPRADLAGGAVRGARELATRLRAALAADRPPAPRPAVAADVCREAHVRWHIAAAQAADEIEEPEPEPEPAPGLAVCIIGSDPRAVAVTRESLAGQSRPPAEVLEAPEPVAVRSSAELALFLPAGGRLVAGAIETLERAAATGAEVIALPVATVGRSGGRIRVPVGGPAASGLLRRVLGDGAFAIRRATLERLGGFDGAERPEMQAHQLLCRAALAGIRIEVLPEPLVTGLAEAAAGEMELLDPSMRHERLLAAYRDADADALRGLPLLTQQLWANARQRERDFERLYQHRFGRLTLPIRRARNRLRRAATMLAKRGRK